MASNINPNNIDGAYPVAGQDNNSQGFRDNFTNTKTNFEYAKNEINDLQQNVVLKAALSGQTLNNDMLGSIVSNATIQDMALTRVSLGSLSGSVGINYAAGHYQTVTTAGSISLAFTNFPPAGSQGIVTVQVTVSNAAHTLTLPAAVSVNTAGITGLSSNVITFAAAGIYSFQFSTSDGGTTITVNEVNKKLQPFNNTAEDLANGAAASLAVTTSYFTTAGAETATLGAAPTGVIKVFYARDVTSGPMVITASSPAWGGAGTITFSSNGQGCTLLSTGGGWVCIGNNGAVFA